MPMFYQTRRKALITRLARYADCNCDRCKRDYITDNAGLKKLDGVSSAMTVDYYSTMTQFPCNDKELRGINYPPHRDGLFRYIGELLECKCIRCNHIAEEGMERLAKRDGSKFNGWYYYHNLVAGNPMRSGLSAAIHGGGIAAASAYLSSGGPIR